MSEDIDMKVKEEEPEEVVVEGERRPTKFFVGVYCSRRTLHLKRLGGKDEQLTYGLRAVKHTKGNEGQNETPEQRRERRDRENERARLWKQNETPEQRRQRVARKTEQQRIRRAKAKEMHQSEATAATGKHITDDESAEEEQGAQVDRGNERQNETPEQRRERENERARLWKQNETPEQRRQRVARKTEQQRIRRAKAKEMHQSEATAATDQDMIADESTEEEQEGLDRANDSARLQEQNESAEKRRQILARKTELQRIRRRKAYETWKHMTDDELAEDCKRILMEKRDKWGQKLKWDEGPDGKLLMTRTEMENVKRGHHCFLERKRREDKMSPEKLAHKKELQRFKYLVRSAHMTEEERRLKTLKNYLRRHAYEAGMSDAQKDEARRKQRERKKRQYRNMTEEQRNKYRIAQHRSIRKYHANEKNREKFRQYQKQRWVNLTPEQRRKTLQYQRISQAQRLLKRKLEAAGTTQEEIKKQVDQLVSRMKSDPLPPLEQVSAYKPRPRKKQRPEVQTPSVEINDQDYHHTSSSSEALQMASASGNLLSQNIESDISGSKLDAPTYPLTLSQSVSISQEETSNVNPEEGDTEYYCGPEPDDIVVTPTHSPHPPSPIFDNEQTDSMEKTYLAVPPEEQTADETILVQPSPPLITQHPTLPSAEPSLPPILESSLNEKKCIHCSSTFPKVSQLHSHVRSKHEEKCWKCPTCSSVLLSTGELLEHFKSRHAGPEQEDADHTIATITESRETFKTKWDQLRSRKAASKSVKTLPFICMKCPSLSSKSQFETVDTLLGHVRISHPKAFWPCPQCKLLKYNPSSLKIHSKICTKKLNS